MKNQKGITLIALVITIIVLLILAGVSISSLVGDNGVVTKAKDAAEKFNDAKALELETLGSLESYVISETRIPTTMWVGTATGNQGVLKLPQSLNDCSKEYILAVESSLYKGQVCIKVYGLGEMYMGAAAFDSEENYIVEARYLLSNKTSLFTDEGIAVVHYDSDGTDNFLYYDLDMLGSELTVTKIQSLDKEYTGTNKIAFKYVKGEKLTYHDALEAVQFCIDSGNLGYDYVNRQYNTNELNEDLEMSLLKNVLSNEVEKLETLETVILDEMALLIHLASRSTVAYINDTVGMTLSINQINPYTLLDWVEENKWLNEYYTRLLGNSITPFTVIFENAILKDINDDGALALKTNFSVQNYLQSDIYPDTGYAGFQLRTYADFFATLGPVIEKDPEGKNLSDIDRMKGMEVYYVEYPSSDSSNNAIYNYFGTYAQNMLKIYEAREMDYMYFLMYQNGIKVNAAGLRLGWNSLIIPETYGYKMGIVGEYDFLSDTKYIEMQGVTHLKDELYEFIVNAKEIDVSDIVTDV